MGGSLLLLLLQRLDFFEDVWVLDVVGEGVQQSIMVIKGNILLFTHGFVPKLKLFLFHPIEIFPIFLHFFDLLDSLVLMDFSGQFPNS